MHMETSIEIWRGKSSILTVHLTRLMHSIVGSYWYSPIPDLLGNVATLELMAYNRSFLSNDPECQKIHRKTEFPPLSHYRMKW